MIQMIRFIGTETEDAVLYSILCVFMIKFQVPIQFLLCFLSENWRASFLSYLYQYLPFLYTYCPDTDHVAFIFILLLLLFRQFPEILLHSYILIFIFL